ncbi:MAG TPA: aconitate hydratase AcnA [Steroidobacteraceae bacterium]|nr:aconitate hydratase AcnA [Steroidobacteraceae bacterium]
MTDSFKARTTLEVGKRKYQTLSLGALKAHKVDRLPFSLKILLENLLRFEDGVNVKKSDIEALIHWDPKATPHYEIAFTPARVIMQDFTGVPCIVDLAAMREAIVRLGGDPQRVNPLAPAELVIDHSVQVDEYGSADSLEHNTQIEFGRNGERYMFLRWGQSAFSNFKVVPPNTGIVHQVNIERLARVIFSDDSSGAPAAYPDTLVGTDSHTTMVNGLGVLGWGVGGIEAEAAMLGQPVTMLIPQVIGFKLTGSLPAGTTATDLVLTVTEILRKKGVVDKFVEFFGDGLKGLPLADRATIANMSPEFGSTCAIFPIDEETIRYLELTGRSREQIALVEAYAKAQGLWRVDGAPAADYTDIVELDLGSVEPALAGPKRPQDRVPLRSAKSVYRASLQKMAEERAQKNPKATGSAPAAIGGKSIDIKDGAVLIAAITSCTNTSNPAVLVGAGLLARKARALGLSSQPWVKTSLAPGSRVVTDYLKKAGLLADLEALGFYTVGYGCTTCIAEGTPVLLADGTSRRIESLPAAGGMRLLAPRAEGRLQTAIQSERMDQGERDCVSIVLEDGRSLACTPDHRILCSDGRWVRADELVLDGDRVLVGLDAPIDEPGADEQAYELSVGNRVFRMANDRARRCTLAFGRLLGHLLSDGSISCEGQARMNVGQMFDREAVLNDVELLTGKRPVASAYDDRKWSIVLPKELSQSVQSLAGVRIGRRIDQPAFLPHFLLEEDCPVAVIREFLGGLFGADGHAPTLHRYGKTEDEASLEPPAYSQSAKPEFVDSTKQKMTHIIELLTRCGVDVQGAVIREYPTRRSASTYPSPRDGIARGEIRLELPDGLSFIERVGYRYSIDKTLRASAAAVYWRTVATVNRQRLWMADRLESMHRSAVGQSFSRSRALAAAELTELETPISHYSLLQGHDRFARLPAVTARPFRPLHRESWNFPSPARLLAQLGVRHWFGALGGSESLAQTKRYCLDKKSITLPALSLRVIDRRPAGRRQIFDIAVPEAQAFIAGNVAVHNCIGNSGPLKTEISEAVKTGDLIACSVLSGNRNFEGRVHPEVKMNFLASPPLVVAYALAGTLDIDITTEPLGNGKNGKPVYLKDIWPSAAEVAREVARSLDSAMFTKGYSNVFQGDANWRGIKTPEGRIYTWDVKSTYVKNPPYFEGMTMTPAPVGDIKSARALAVLGDSVTTDHISPAGNIAKSSPAAKYLIAQGVDVRDFNSYGARRGNHEVMMRGTFANIRLRNLLLPGTEGGVTVHIPSGETLSIYDAAMRYKTESTPLVILAGKEYGTGSSRDWAAKGTMLLGVKAVIGESFERIHRSNLIGMGVLPLQFKSGENAQSLGLTGRETFDIVGLQHGSAKTVTVIAKSDDGKSKRFEARVRIDTPKELDYYQHGGILHYVLRQLAGARKAA